MTGGDAIPDDRRYAKSHEWAQASGAEVVVGISDHAQAELTDIVFVELPPIGKTVAAGDGILVLESVKTVADVYAPVAGTVVAVNDALKAHPELVNHEPYAGGWLVRLRPNAPFDGAGLLDAAGYRASLSG